MSVSKPLGGGHVEHFATARSGSLLAPVRWELPALFAWTLVLFAVDDLETQAVLNYVAPVILMGVLGYTTITMLMLESRLAWSPMLWFRVSTSLYFGFGCLIPLILNERSRLYIDSFFILQTHDIFKVNLVVVAGVVVVLAVNALCEARPTASRTTSGWAKLPRIDDAFRMGLMFILAGSSIKYLIVLPNVLAGSPIVLPGFVVNLTAFSVVGIALLTIWASCGGWARFIWVSALVLVETAVGLLQFSKIESLTPLVAFVLALLTVKATRIRLIVVLVGFLFTFDFVQGLTTHARLENIKLGGGQQLEFSQRIQFFTSYFSADGPAAETEPMQLGLIRLTFTNAAAFVIDRYDRGFPGDSLRDVLYSPIPRFLWPDKPRVLVGAELASLATDTVGNTISCGFFAELYWNLGWPGLLLLIPVGVVFNYGSRIALKIAESGEWIYLPVLFMNLKTAISIDSFYIGFVGATIINLGVYAMLSLAVPWLQQIGLLKSVRTGPAS